MTWFSACLRMVCLIEGEGFVRYEDSVVLMRQPNRESAFERALELGAVRESTFINADGASVRWAFVRVLTLDELGTTIGEDAEVYSQPTFTPEDGEGLNMYSTFSPQVSPPNNSI